MINISRVWGSFRKIFSSCCWTAAGSTIAFFLTKNLALSLPGCIAAALGFPWLQLGHFRFKRLQKWQINSSVTLSRALRFDSSSDEAETNTSLSDREEVMMFHFYIKACNIECTRLEGRSGSTSFSYTFAAMHRLSYLREKWKCCSCLRCIWLSAFLLSGIVCWWR